MTKKDIKKRQEEIIRIKRTIMQDALAEDVDNYAKVVSYVDMLYDLAKNKEVETYSQDKDIVRCGKYIFDYDIELDRKTLEIYLKNTPDKGYFYISEERSEHIGDFYGLMDKVANEDFKNLYLILVEPNVRGSKFNTLWASKDLTQPIKSPIKVYTDIGDSFRDMNIEMNNEKLTTFLESLLDNKLTTDLYRQWSDRIEENENKRSLTLLNQINEYKKQKASKQEGK